VVVIGDIGAGENEAERITQGIAGEMDLGGKAGLGAAHGLGELAAGWAGAMGVHSHGRAFDEQVFVVALSAEGGEQSGPQPAGGPAPEPRIDAGPAAKAGRQVPLGSAGAQNSEKGLEAQALVGAFATTPMDPAQGLPVGLNFFKFAPVFIAQNEP